MPSDKFDRLSIYAGEADWEKVINFLKPKDFSRESGELLEFPILAKCGELLTNPDKDVPLKVKIALLKCLQNSCVDGFWQKSLDNVDTGNNVNVYTHILQSLEQLEAGAYPTLNHFPYEGMALWARDHIINNAQEGAKDDALEVVRLSIQFLCNLFTFACKNDDYPSLEEHPSCLNNEQFKSIVIDLTQHEQLPVARAACAFVHNGLRELPSSYYLTDYGAKLAQVLIEPAKLGINPAADSLLFLMKQPNHLRDVYEGLSIEDKLALLDLVHQEVCELVYKNEESLEEVEEDEESESEAQNISEIVKFLAERFKTRSDLILKTVDSYLEGFEPQEITVMLEIIGVLTSSVTPNSSILQSDKSLFINCVFLLKSLHMAGKESKNFFTPLQKLSEVAPNAQSNGGKDDPEKHPAFGFKANLIRAIGNLIYRHKENQNLLRESEGIQLLLDCCNIDARNPMIIQWVILAMKHACESNPENQEIVRGCTKIGTINSSVLCELGITLHEDKSGGKIGVVPLEKPSN